VGIIENLIQAIATIVAALISTLKGKLKPTSIIITILVICLITLAIVFAIYANSNKSQETFADTSQTTTITSTETTVNTTVSLIETIIPEKSEKDASSVLLDSEENVLGNVFAILYKDNVYYITTFKNLVDAYSSSDKTLRLSFEENPYVLSSDLSLVSYSPLYNLAVLKPKKDINVTSYTLSNNDPYTGDIIIKGTTLGKQKPIETIDGSIVDVLELNEVTNQKEILTDAMAENMNGAVVLDKTTEQVIAINTGFTKDGKAILIPVTTLKSVLNEIPSLEIFPLDELPEKFPYIFSYTNSYSATTDFEDIKFSRNDTSSELYQAKDGGKYGLSVSDYNTYVFLDEYDYGQTLYRDSDNNKPMIYYGYKKTVDEDGHYYVDLGKSYYRYYEDDSGSILSNGGAYQLLYRPNDKRFWIYGSNDSIELSVSDEYIEYNDGSKILRIDAKTQEIIKNDFEKVPENVKITYNSDGYKLKIEDTEKGFTAYVKDDSTYGIEGQKLFGEYKSDGAVSLKKEEEGNPQSDNIEASIYKNNENYRIRVWYQDKPEIYASLHFGTEFDNSNLHLNTGKMYAAYTLNGDMAITTTDNIAEVYYDKSENSIYSGASNSDGYRNGKGIKMSPTYYLIGNFEKGVFDGTYYPYLLDWRDIPDTPAS
jgi:hypothetical protein